MNNQNGPTATLEELRFDETGRMVRELTCSCGAARDVKAGSDWKSDETSRQRFDEIAADLLGSWFWAHARGETFGSPRCGKLAGVVSS